MTLLVPSSETDLPTPWGPGRLSAGRRHLGNGYAERVPGTGKLLDTLHGVNIDVLSAGRFPGDDKPKPI